MDPIKNEVNTKDKDDKYKILEGDVFYKLFNMDRCKIIVDNIKAILDIIKDNDNSEKCVLDLGGGNGSYGVMIMNILNAKKAIIYEPDTSLIELGKNTYSELVKDGKLEYCCEFMENMLTKEKNSICFIIIKECIQFTNESFFRKLIKFCKNNLKGILLIAGIIDYSLWKIPLLPFPKTAQDALKSRLFTTSHCADIVKEDKSIKFNYKIETIFSEMPFEEYSFFILKKGWSNLFKCSDNELQECVDFHVSKSKNEGKSTVSFNKEYGFLSIHFNIN